MRDNDGHRRGDRYGDGGCYNGQRASNHDRNEHVNNGGGTRRRRRRRRMCAIRG